MQNGCCSRKATCPPQEEASSQVISHPCGTDVHRVPGDRKNTGEDQGSCQGEKRSDTGRRAIHGDGHRLRYLLHTSLNSLLSVQSHSYHTIPPVSRCLYNACAILQNDVVLVYYKCETADCNLLDNGSSVLVFVLILMSNVRVHSVVKSHQGLADSFACTYHWLQNCNGNRAYHSSNRALRCR